MKFVRRDMGEAAEINSGGGTRGALVELAKLAALMGAALVVIWLVAGLAAEMAVLGLSPEREAELFAGISPGMPELEPRTEDLRRKMEMAQAVFARLTASPLVPKISYRLVFADVAEPNAYAIPGGLVVVTRGLLEEMDGEAGMAFVLGHELGHFRNRDHLRGITRQAGTAVLLSILFNGAGADSMTMRVHDSLSLAYSREQEQAADYFGVELVHSIYGKAEGVDRLFHILKRREILPAWAYMFSTHPDSQERIRKLEEHATRLEKKSSD